jgi:hypothetical protein
MGLLNNIIISFVVLINIIFIIDLINDRKKDKIKHNRDRLKRGDCAALLFLFLIVSFLAWMILYAISGAIIESLAEKEDVLIQTNKMYYGLNESEDYYTVFTFSTDTGEIECTSLLKDKCEIVHDEKVETKEDMFIEKYDKKIKSDFTNKLLGEEMNSDISKIKYKIHVPVYKEEDYKGAE